METRVLFWFQQIADGATVTQVSEVEYTTQSGISRALARLEASWARRCCDEKDEHCG
jgi:DNA-binding transcriptional LysR family regulator